MSEHRVPQWHPISALPMIAQALDGMLESAEDVLQSLEQARPRPHVLDDYTIGRVRKAHGTDGDGVIVPVLAIQAPPGPDESRFYNTILEVLIAPHNPRERVPQATSADGRKRP